MAAAVVALALAATPIQAAAANQAPVVDKVGTGQPVALMASQGRHCFPEFKACFAVVPDPERGEQAMRLAISDLADPADLKHEPLAYGIDHDRTLEFWPYALPLPGGAPALRTWVIGVIERRRVAYSGGGAEVSRLHLHALAVGHVGSVSPELANLPWHSALSIRACFNAEQARRRLDVCQDQYTFGATLQVAADSSGDQLPDLIYRTQATAFPQTTRRWEDSSTGRPLTQADLSHWTDFECSYQRRLRFNPATERYEMDRPAPDCRSYTDP